MIRVVNTKTNAPSGNDVYIGRGSVFGNPYTHMPIEKTLADFQVSSREEAIRLYRENFGKLLREKDGARDLFGMMLMKALMGFDINLVCHCSPKSCHGDVIKELLEALVQAMKGILPIAEITATSEPGIYKLPDKVEAYRIMPLIEFIECTDEGDIMDDDGWIADVLIDGQKTNIYVSGWGGYYGKDPKSIELDLEELKNLSDIVSINWANK